MEMEMKITFDRNKLLGRGGYGTVYEGVWDKKRVAVKRIQLIDVKSCEKEEVALRKLNHPNVIKLFHVEEDKDYRYYAIELCQASLDKLFLRDEDKEKYRGPMPPKMDVLSQLAIGLEYIHKMGLIHRDIKPENVLICQTEEVLIKWADFGLSKSVNKSGSCSMSGNKGTDNWRAPEMLNIKSGTRTSVKSDVFAEGLVFGYFLLKGQHPFQFENSKTETNIENLKLDNVKKMQPQYERDLILKMLTREPENRITSSDVVDELKQIRKKIHDDQTQLLFNFFKAETCPSVNEITNLLEETKKIIKERIDFNYGDKNGCTPLLLLMQSKKNGNENLLELLRFLMRNEVDVNIKNNYGWNALHFLCWFNNKNENLIDIIRLLIEKKIDVNCKDEYGQNILHLLCKYYKNENLIDIIQLLIEKGIDVNCNDCFGNNALSYLRQFYNKANKDEIVNLLQLESTSHMSSSKK